MCLYVQVVKINIMKNNNYWCSMRFSEKEGLQTLNQRVTGSSPVAPTK